MERCLAFAVNKSYPTDRWVFADQILNDRHGTLFTRHVECCLSVKFLGNDQQNMSHWNVTRSKDMSCQ